MRHLNEYQHHLRVLLEPYDAKVSRTVLRGESPAMGLTYSTHLATPTRARLPQAGSEPASSSS